MTVQKFEPESKDENESDGNRVLDREHLNQSNDIGLEYGSGDDRGMTVLRSDGEQAMEEVHGSRESRDIGGHNLKGGKVLNGNDAVCGFMKEHSRKLLPTEKLKTDIEMKRKRKSRHRIRPNRKEKWRAFPDELVDFKLSLLPRPSHQECRGLAQDEDIIEEVMRFEEPAGDCQDDDNKEPCDCLGDDIQGPHECVGDSIQRYAEDMNETREKFEDDVSLLPPEATDVPNKLIMFRDCDIGDVELTYGWEVSRVNDQLIDEFADDLTLCRRMRAKKKWRVEKAHKQIKSKHCSDVRNCVHGQSFYIHHRVAKLMPMVIQTTRFEVSVSFKSIDKKSQSIQKSLDFKRSTEYSVFRSPRKTEKVPKVDRTFAVDVYTVDGAIPDDIVNILINIQDRDLTPEDYELLLRLDERVSPKTLDGDRIQTLATDVVADMDKLSEMLCTICQELFEVGQTRKHLPCGHVFHAACIDGWLSLSSTKCPLDGVEVFT